MLYGGLWSRFFIVLREGLAMRHGIWRALGVSFLRSLSVARAADAPATADSTAKPEAAADSAKPADSQSSGEAWRYRRHNGLWWYWLPSNKWVYWRDNRWVPYEQKSYVEYNNTRVPQSYGYSNSYSSNPGNYPGGNWGPVRYNEYGQRQWPYSQRNSGLQQLGPTPALGGVRSLPGWGGER